MTFEISNIISKTWIIHSRYMQDLSTFHSKKEVFSSIPLLQRKSINRQSNQQLSITAHFTTHSNSNRFVNLSFHFETYFIKPHNTLHCLHHRHSAPGKSRPQFYEIPPSVNQSFFHFMQVLRNLPGHAYAHSARNFLCVLKDYIYTDHFFIVHVGIYINHLEH